MRRPAKTPNVPIRHTAMKTHSRMWSNTMATNFHSSAACKHRKGTICHKYKKNKTIRNTLYEKKHYIVGFLVWFHGFCYVLDSFDGTADIRILGDGGLVGNSSGLVARDVWDVKISTVDIFSLLFFPRPFHCWEEHDVGNGFDENLSQKKTKTEDEHSVEKLYFTVLA